MPFALPIFVCMAVGIAQSDYTLEVVLVAYPAAAACGIGVVAVIRSLAVREPVAAH